MEGFGPAGQRSFEDSDPVFGMEATLSKFSTDAEQPTLSTHVDRTMRPSQWQRVCEEVEMMAVYAHPDHHCECLHIDHEMLMDHMTELWPDGLALWQAEALEAHARILASGFDPALRAKARRCRRCGKSDVDSAPPSESRSVGLQVGRDCLA